MNDPACVPHTLRMDAAVSVRTRGLLVRHRPLAQAKPALLRNVRGVLVFAIILLCGCATQPTTRSLLEEPIQVRVIDGSPAMQDGRAGFRKAFCAGMHSDGLVTGEDMSCDRWLWHLPDEADAASIGPLPALQPERLAIFLVTGAFSECVGEEARPFSAGAAGLRSSGAHVETIVVSGRSGSDHNAQQIADVLENAQLHGDETTILIGFSKGALDILHFLVNFPERAGQVDAVVSIASPIFGSQLADMADPVYSNLLARLPYPTCPPGDGNIIRSLRTDIAAQWLESNVLPEHVRYYSLASFTTREHVARGLVSTWRLLNRIDPRNDGQVIAADAVIPGATLLGYTNADHWGTATTIESVHTYLGARPDPAPFPLETLFSSIVQFVSTDLAMRNASRGNPERALSAGN
jgi:pimeloyl-ACP methyl ester carboxylesterase